MSILDAFFTKHKKIVEELERTDTSPKFESTSRWKGVPNLDQFIGQDHIIPIIKTAITAFRNRDRVPGHFLIYGPYGVGKSLLAKTICMEILGLHREYLGTFLTNKDAFDDIKPFLMNKFPRKTVFIDEIHAMNKKVQEMLYTPIQDFVLDGVPILRFTLVGTTTDPGILLPAMRSRFTHQIQLSLYTEEDLAKIIAHKYYLFEEDIVNFVATRSKGCARHAMMLSESIEDASVAEEADLPEMKHAEFVALTLGITNEGLTKTDISILVELLKAGKSSVSKRVLSSLSGISHLDLEFMYEPFLLKKGLVAISSRGRALSGFGREYLFENKKHFMEMGFEQAVEIK